jgi:hypothetical protein
MATQQEIFNLMQQYTKFDQMFINAVQTGNTSEATDLQLQMGKIREKLASLGEVANPIQPTNEQPS